MNRNSSRILAVVAAAGFAASLAGCKMMADAKSGAKTSSSAGTSQFAPEPDVTFQQLQGGNLPLASLKGKVVLVNFWATWCDPCRIEIPWLISFQQKYAGQGFTIIGVAMDEEGKPVVEPYVEKTKFEVSKNVEMTMNYPIMIGNEDIAEKFGGLLGYPSSFLISRDGRVVKKIIGLVSEDEIASEIERQLAVPAPAASSTSTAALH